MSLKSILKMDYEYSPVFTNLWVNFIRMLQSTYYPNTPYINVAKFVRSTFGITQADIRNGMYVLTERYFLIKTNDCLLEDEAEFKKKREERMKVLFDSNHKVESESVA